MSGSAAEIAFPGGYPPVINSFQNSPNIMQRGVSAGAVIILCAAGAIAWTQLPHGNNSGPNHSGGVASSQDPSGERSRSPSPEPTTEDSEPPAPVKKPRDPKQYGSAYSLTSDSTGKAVLQATTDIQAIGCYPTVQDHFNKKSWAYTELLQLRANLREPYQHGLPLGLKTRKYIDKAKKLGDKSCGYKIQPDFKVPGCFIGPLVPGTKVVAGTICPDGSPDGKSVKPNKKGVVGCPGSFIDGTAPFLRNRKVNCEKGGPNWDAGIYKNNLLIAPLRSK